MEVALNEIDVYKRQVLHMDVFRTDRIRNVVLLGHGGAGKTTLAEAMAYLAGMTSRLGRVEDGNTVSDYDKEEIKRHFSITTSLIPVPWDKVKVNVLDTCLLYTSRNPISRMLCSSIQQDVFTLMRI